MRIYKVHYVLVIKFGVSSRTNIIDVLAVRQWYIKKETIVTQDSWCSSLSEFPQAISSLTSQRKLQGAHYMPQHEFR